MTELFISHFSKGFSASACAAWVKAKDRPPIAVILKALDEQKKSEQWLKDNGQFIPKPTNWLNAGQWDDVAILPKKPLSYEDLYFSHLKEKSPKGPVVINNPAAGLLPGSGADLEK